MRRVAVFALTLVSSACANPDVTGNAEGGMVDIGFSSEKQAFAAAEAHCKTYGRSARLTQIERKGSTVLFECVKP